MKKSMNDYINEQRGALEHIIHESRETFEAFVRKYEEKDINRIIIVASGSSYNASIATKYFIEKLLNKEVSVRYPYLFNNYDSILDKNSLVVAVTQSGQSAATIDAIKKAGELGISNVVVTADQSSPIARYAEEIIMIKCGEETFGAKTMGYTSTVMTLMLMAVETAYYCKHIGCQEYKSYLSNFKLLIENIGSIIDDSNNWYKLNRERFINGNKVMVVGSGPNFGTALEGGLKVHETVRCPVSEHELEEFMHGPYLALDEECFVFFIASPGIGKNRMFDLFEYVSKITPNCFIISDKHYDEKNVKNLKINSLGIEDISPIEYVIPMQILAFNMAVDKGVNLSVSKFPDFDSFLHSKV